jgi:hypothetical protein
MFIDEEQELSKIADFLAATAGCIKSTIRMILERAGCNVIEHGDKFNLYFEVRYGENCAHFFLQNLYLEIATRDRDARPLQFDEKLNDYSYFLSKASFVIRSKLEILLKLLKCNDVNKTIDEIYEKFKGERIFIEKVGKSRRKNGFCPN